MKSTGVHLWCLRADTLMFDRLLQSVDQIVSKEELIRSRRIVPGKPRASYLVRRAFVRLVLSQYADVTPRNWSFGVGKYGKPAIEGPLEARNLVFNLSHSNGQMVCLVTVDRAVGVDIEARDPTIDVEEIADHYFTSQEADDLRRLPHDERIRQFLRLWTLKEAFAKARGLGLSLRFHDFSFSFGKDGVIGLASRYAAVHEGKNWCFRLIEPYNDCVLAVALSRAPGEFGDRWQSAIQIMTILFDDAAYERGFGSQSKNARQGSRSDENSATEPETAVDVDSNINVGFESQSVTEGHETRP